MRYSYWAWLFALASLPLTLNIFLSSGPADYLNASPCSGEKWTANAHPHPFLCGQRMSIRAATIADIKSIDGISTKKAKAIAGFIKANPEKTLEELENIHGIGIKTIERLKLYFY